MRIGMFSNAYKPTISGVVRSIDLFTQGLRRQGHFVSIFAPDSHDYEDDEPFVFRYPALPLPSDLDYSLPVLVAPQIDWLVPRLKLDIIHAHHPVVVGNAALNFSRELGIPLVFTFHTLYHEYTHYFGFDTALARQIVKRIVANFARKADQIIVPSRAVAHIVTHDYGIDRPYEILPTPIDLDDYPLRSPETLFRGSSIQLIYVGRIAKEKNLDFLLRAFARAFREDNRLRLRLVGGGPELETMRELAERMGLSEAVSFTGRVPFARIPSELAGADLFVFPSLTETQGLVVLEAMAAGLPMVLVDSPALLEHARPDRDCLVAPPQEEAFAAAILALVRDPDRARALGASARRQAEALSVPALTARLVTIYEATITRYHRRSET
jgi:glycosyltransferase involved in cell wall biosynthesis